MWLLVAAACGLLEVSLEAEAEAEAVAVFVVWRSTTSGARGFISGKNRAWRGPVSRSLGFGMVLGVEASASDMGCRRTALDSLEPIVNMIEYVL